VEDGAESAAAAAEEPALADVVAVGDVVLEPGEEAPDDAAGDDAAGEAVALPAGTVERPLTETAGGGTLLGAAAPLALEVFWPAEALSVPDGDADELPDAAEESAGGDEPLLVEGGVDPESEEEPELPGGVPGFWALFDVPMDSVHCLTS